MVGMQHEDRAQELDRREILVGVDDPGPEHVAAKGLHRRHVGDQRLTPSPSGSERPKSSAFIHGVPVRFMTMIIAPRSRS